MRINEVKIDDTFAEAFDMVVSRVLITAKNKKWAMKASEKFVGFATSVIECGAEAEVESVADPTETPDGRPGANVLITAMSEDGLEEQLRARIGQCVMTSPTSACFNNLEEGDKIKIGGDLRYFGDGYQIPKRVSGDFSKDGRRLWRIPVMEGEFIIDEEFRVKKGAVGGGNFFVLGENGDRALEASEKAVEAIKEVRGVITPFPGGIVRSGSKTESKYSFLNASTNTAYCPTIKSIVENEIPEGVNSILEIVINGLDEECVQKAMKRGIENACTVSGVKAISAGNYGGSLGQHLFHLHDLLEADP